LTCKEFIEFLWQYLSDELTAEQKRIFEEHLGVCPDCVAYLHSYEETVRMGRRAFVDEEAEVPESVPEEFVQAVLAARGEETH